MSCTTPVATRKVFNPGTGPRAWCPSCKSWQAAAQVPWGQELRNANGIAATYAPVVH